MNIRFDTLLTLEVTHAYYGAACRDLAYVLPSDTTAACASRRLLVRELEGRLHVLIERSGAAPVADPTGLMLRVGLRPASASFSTITQLTIDPDAPLLLFDNAVAPGQLVAAASARLVSSRFTHTITEAARPVTLQLLTADGTELATETITDSTSTWTCLLAHKPAGLYRVEETFPAANAASRYYHDTELAAAGVLAVCEIRVDSSFLAATAALTVPFTAREEVLKYYVIASGFSAPELAQLQVTDTGFADDARPEVQFQRRTEAQFGPGDLPPALIRGAEDTVVLFRSQAPIARRAAPRRKIELRRQNETLVAHLPSPAPHQPSADLLIHISKH